MTKDEAIVTKCCTLCCFNVLYLIAGGVFLFDIYALTAVKTVAKYDVGPSYVPAFALVTVSGVLMILIAIFGCVALFVSKPPLYIVVRSIDPRIIEISLKAFH